SIFKEHFGNLVNYELVMYNKKNIYLEIKLERLKIDCYDLSETNCLNKNFYDGKKLDSSIGVYAFINQETKELEYIGQTVTPKNKNRSMSERLAQYISKDPNNEPSTGNTLAKNYLYFNKSHSWSDYIDFLNNCYILTFELPIESSKENYQNILLIERAFLTLFDTKYNKK
ncbi:MAG: hypothetical protein ACOCUI_04540, partial [bacterium]